MTARVHEARRVAESVHDPELPWLTVADLGILRDVASEGDHVTVTITPTFSGCPAMQAIQEDLRAALTRAGFRHVEIQVQLRPPWTSDWITQDGRRKLAAAGIAPPHAVPHGELQIALTRPRDTVTCPRCGATNTTERSRFGSTPCKALYRCDTCLEPFEYVKPF